MRAISLLIGVLLVLLQTAVVAHPPSAVAAPVHVVAPVAAQDDKTEPGPTLDPQTEADAEKSRSRLVVGTMAVVLLGVVLWGRYLRKKRGGGS